MPILPGDFATWSEDESPYRLVLDCVGANGRLGLDDQLLLFVYRCSAVLFATRGWRITLINARAGRSHRARSR